MLILLVAAIIFILLGTRSSEKESSGEDTLESRVAEMCQSVDGVGKCKVLIYYEPQSSRYEEEKVASVLVVCEGGDSVKIKKSLTEMLSSFFGIGSNRVRIEKMRN